MRPRGKDGRIRLPNVAETPASSIFPRNPQPETTACTFAVVANHTGDDLTCPTTQDCPGAFFDKRPDLIHLSGVVRLGWSERGRQRRQEAKFF